MKREPKTYRYDVRYKPATDLHSLEAWLREHCAGKFEYHVVDAAAGGNDKGADDFIFRFERADDQARFREMILAPTAS